MEGLHWYLKFVLKTLENSIYLRRDGCNKLIKIIKYPQVSGKYNKNNYNMLGWECLQYGVDTWGYFGQWTL